MRVPRYLDSRGGVVKSDYDMALGTHSPHYTLPLFEVHIEISTSETNVCLGIAPGLFISRVKDVNF